MTFVFCTSPLPSRQLVNKRKNGEAESGVNNLSVTERLSQTNQNSEYKYQDYRQTAAVVIQPNMGGVFRGQRIWMVYLHLIFFLY